MHILDHSPPGPGPGQAYNHTGNRKNSLSYPKSPKAAHHTLNGHGHDASSTPLARIVSGANAHHQHPVAPHPRRSPSTSSIEVIQGRRPGEIFMPEGVVDMTSFGQILAMDENDPTREFSKALVWAWCDQAEMAVEEMQHFINEGRIVPVADKAHYLKGSSSSLGLSKVSATCQSIYHVHFPPSLAHMRAFSYNNNVSGGSGNSSSSSSSGASSARFSSERSSASSAASSAPSSVAASPYSSYNAAKDGGLGERRGSLPSLDTSSPSPSPQPPVTPSDETGAAEMSSSHQSQQQQQQAYSPPMTMSPANMNAQQPNSFQFAIKSMSPQSSSASQSSGRTSSADIYSPHMYAKDSPHHASMNSKMGVNGQSAAGQVDSAAHFEREKLRRAQELLKRLMYEIREGSEWLYTYYQESDRYAGVPSAHSS